MATVCSTVPSVLSIINSHGHDENGENEVCHWRSWKTASHLVSEARGWSAPAAVTVASFVDHTNQEPVCFALLVREVLKRLFPLTRPGHVLGPNEKLPRCHLAACRCNGWLQRAFPGWETWNQCYFDLRGWLAPVSVERVFSRTLCTFSTMKENDGKWKKMKREWKKNERKMKEKWKTNLKEKMIRKMIRKNDQKKWSEKMIRKIDQKMIRKNDKKKW